MSHALRDSLELIRNVRPENGQDALEAEILGEKAASLGAAEKRVIEAIAQLDQDADDEPEMLSNAQKAVWGYFVQRELLGFRKHQEVVRDLGIPKRVLFNLGAQPSGR